MEFSKLSEPLTLGTVTLRNRLVMGAMHLGFEGEPGSIERLAAFYVERAKGGVGLIITGGSEIEAIIAQFKDTEAQKSITKAVHAEGAKILCQFMPGGPLADKGPVGPSVVISPINPSNPPRALTPQEIEAFVGKCVEAANLAKQAEYDGIELHVSEGFLLSCFLTPKTNKRTDQWGGTAENRMRFPLEILRKIRAATGPDFILSLRLSLLDLIEDGTKWPDVVAFAKKAKEAGVNMLNSNVAWFESPVPTSTQIVPRGAFVWATAKLKQAIALPIVASHRINTPELAEKILQDGSADLISMCRPLLADPEFMLKAVSGRKSEINTCIACNQLCIDRMIAKKEPVSCLVNPRAGYELQLVSRPAVSKKKIAVIGAGPAGLWFSMTATRRGHEVVLFEADKQIGGQLNFAKQVPGKEEFYETLRYCQRQIELLKIDLRLNTKATPEMLLAGDFDEIIVATGVTPHKPPIEGLDRPNVLLYSEVLNGKLPAGKDIVLIGAGPIAFDIAQFLLVKKEDYTLDGYCREWGIDRTLINAGGLTKSTFAASPVSKQIKMMQRKKTNPILTMGKSTGWVHRAMLLRRGVRMLLGVAYRKIDAQGVHVVYEGGKTEIVKADTVIVCAGQKSREDLAAPLRTAGQRVTVIGGAERCDGLDAARAINQGVRVALEI